MKSSPTSSSSSSSSSCFGFNIACESKKPKTRRARKNHNPVKCQNASSPSSARRSSIYRGVTRHRWTGRFEAHLWDKNSWNVIQNKKGRQVYLGAYDSEESAAHTYDLAALKYWGPDTTLNFPIDTYTKELEEMQKVSKEEYLASLRRRSSGFSRGVSKYRGVARHHHNGRWEARIGRVFGNKYLYLGTYNTQEEAAAAYDMAAIEYRGPNAVTNFDMSNYIDCMNKKALPLVQTQQEPLPNCSIQSDKVEVEVEVEQPPQPQQQQQQQQIVSVPQLQYTHLPPCIDTSAMVIMDPADEHELPWSFCMDAGFTHLPVPDFPLYQPCELPDLFDDSGFEDNIDLIFEAGYNANEVGLECVLDNAGCGVEVGVLGGKEEHGQERLLSAFTSSSSPYSSSTTTSVSCNYSV